MAGDALATFGAYLRQLATECIPKVRPEREREDGCIPAARRSGRVCFPVDNIKAGAAAGEDAKVDFQGMQAVRIDLLTNAINDGQTSLPRARKDAASVRHGPTGRAGGPSRARPQSGGDVVCFCQSESRLSAQDPCRCRVQYAPISFLRASRTSLQVQARRLSVPGRWVASGKPGDSGIAQSGTR